MPGFPEITDEELSSLMHYIRQMAKQALIDSEQGNP
jgi:cytochrome c1